MKKNRFLKVLIGFIIITSIFSITVFAKYFTSSDTVINNLGVGSINVKIAEKFTPNDTWNGDKINKNVKVKNTGNNGELVRVSIIPRWIDENGNPWPGDTNLVTLNLKNTVNLGETIKKDTWINGEDGYYYYSSILPNGSQEDIDAEKNNKFNAKSRYDDSLTNNRDGSIKSNYSSEILSSVSLNLNGLSEEERSRYKGKKLIVDVNVEAIAPNKSEISSKWINLNANIKKYLESICN
ncbi:hypothetical protein [Clostridium perfringens]|uniref:Alternate signal-mediated exported protein, CPF_0494 family n=1 Tax=Clostridium perfringens TaxID=1502 RepID=A0A133MSA1_CLOPF|nr:hypothetical protein [Clostridium perfringens]EGT3601075.1 hypothetical protein [Clostridium perfringens]KXA06901.1 hypothetical protein HMPREF3222_02834 [Clostridium perfringens]